MTLLIFGFGEHQTWGTRRRRAMAGARAASVAAACRRRIYLKTFCPPTGARVAQLFFSFFVEVKGLPARHPSPLRHNHWQWAPVSAYVHAIDPTDIGACFTWPDFSLRCSKTHSGDALCDACAENAQVILSAGSFLKILPKIKFHPRFSEESFRQQICAFDANF